MKSVTKYLPAAVVVFGMAFRLLGVMRPFLGNFAMYQSTSAMMAKFFIDTHFTTLLYPQVNVLAAGRPGLLLLAYPVSSLVASVLFLLFGGSLDFWGRFQAVLFFGLAAVYLYRTVQRLWNEKVALAGLIAFTFSPLTIVYGQSFQNEMATVFFSIFFFHALLSFFETGKPRHFFAAALAISLVLVTRPNALYLAGPVCYLVWMLRADERIKVPLGRGAFFVLGVGLILPVLWFTHLWRVSQEETRIYSTLFQQIMVRSSFVSPLALSVSYYQRLLDMLASMALTPVGLTLFIFGAFLGIKKRRAAGFFLVWSLCFLFSSLLIPRKLLDHNFYLLHFVLPASPLIGAAALRMLDSFKDGRRQLALLLVILSFAISMRYALNPAFRTSEQDRYLLEASDAVRKVTNKETSRIVVQGTHTLLYYADRYGWALNLERFPPLSDYDKLTNFQKLSPEKLRRRNNAYRSPETELEYLRTEEGATHFVVTYWAEFKRKTAFFKYVESRFHRLSGVEGRYAIYDLTSSTAQHKMN